MAQTQLQKWEHQEWLMRCEVTKRITKKKNVLGRLLNKSVYSIDDYDIREKGDHFESYNKITKEALFEAFSYEEALADLREAFAV